MVTAAMLTVLVFAAVAVRLRRGMLAVVRAVAPSRVPAGGEVRVTLAVSNLGRVGGGPVLFHDRTPARLAVQARLALPQLPAGAERTIAYVLRPKARGRYVLGPLEVALTDAFGLVLRRRELAGTSALVVYPRFDRLKTAPRDAQRVGAIRRSPLLGSGDEFYALRPFREGDDVRKVHWPTSLRQGEFVVRQEELLRDPGLLVVCDTCAAKHAGEGASSSLEAAVSAAASLAVLALSLDMPVTVITPEGSLLRNRRPSETEVLEALATLEPSGRPSLAPVLGTAPRGAGGASLVVVTPGLDRRELAAASRLAAGAAGGAGLLIDAGSFAAPSRRTRLPAAEPLAALGLPVLTISAGGSFAEVWETGMARAGAGR